MANVPADIAELQRALEVCCQELADAVAAEEALAATTGGDVDASLRWRPLVLAPIPGLDLLVNTIKPPLQIIVALLKVIAALLEALAAILIGILDPLRLIILAVVGLVRDIINDLLNTGVYMYVDAPGITPTESSIRETGLFVAPEKDWVAGRKLAPPPVVPDGFERWAKRFTASFDDPGDLDRPVVTDGAPVQAVFLVMAAPSLGALRQLMYLIGKLLNVDQFKAAYEKYQTPTADPRMARLQQMKGVPPDWRSFRLVDLIPPLKELAKLPDALLGMLTSVDAIVGLIRNLALAMQDKAQVLLQLAEAIQAIIDLLDALKSTGIYALPVATTGGVNGLRDAFLHAVDRPPGGYVGGVCLLASGPNLAKAALLWQMLGMSTAMDLMEGKLTPSQVWDDLKQSSTAKLIEDNYAKVKAAGETLVTTTEEAGAKFASEMMDAAAAFQRAIEGQPDAFFDQLGIGREQYAELIANGRALGVDMLAQAEQTWPHDRESLERALSDTRLAQRTGARSLAMGYDALTASVTVASSPPGPPAAPPAPAGAPTSGDDDDPFGGPL